MFKSLLTSVKLNRAKRKLEVFLRVRFVVGLASIESWLANPCKSSAGAWLLVWVLLSFSHQFYGGLRNYCL